jgi:hypothetical protein
MREHVVYQSFFDAFNQFGTARRIRTATLPIGLPPHLWAIIAIGGSAIVTLTFLFAPDSKAFHVAILACLLVPMTLNILLLAEYSVPFVGTVTVRPVVFEQLRDKVLIVDDKPPKYLREKPVQQVFASD